MPRPITRRRAIKLGGTGALVLGCRKMDAADAAESSSTSAGGEPTEPSDTTLDPVLDEIVATDPEFGGGLSDHAPMACEALIALGHPERVEPFFALYRARLTPLAPEPPLSESEQLAALGDFDRRAAWIATYAEALEDGDPAAVVQQAWARLIPGCAAAAFHGLLRTAHAARALQALNSATRRRELGHGLGYWASRHLLLPGVPGRLAQPGLDVEQALAAVPMIPDDERVVGGIISARMLAVNDHQEFVDAIEAVDLDALAVDQALTLLTAATARLLVVDVNLSNLGTLHALTGGAALRLLLPWLDPSAQRAGLGYLFQAVAAIHATHSATMGLPPAPAAPSMTPAQLADAAAAIDDEHVIKPVEALVREHAIDPRPEYLAAAERLV